MGTFIVYAKYLKTKEEDMETRDSKDLGNLSNLRQTWVYKRQGFDADEIFRPVEYTNNKTLLETYDGVEILCAEPFDEVYKKWSEARQDSPKKPSEDKEINQKDENNPEEDED
jgi:hypothetical protein